LEKLPLQSRSRESGFKSPPENSGWGPTVQRQTS